MLDDAVTFFKTGVNITTGAASANAAMPTDVSGNLPKYVRVSCTAKAYIKPGVSGVVAAAGDLLLDPTESIILKVNGATFIAAIQQAAAGLVNVVPLEDL